MTGGESRGERTRAGIIVRVREKKENIGMGVKCRVESEKSEETEWLLMQKQDGADEQLKRKRDGNSICCRHNHF